MGIKVKIQYVHGDLYPLRQQSVIEGEGQGIIPFMLRFNAQARERLARNIGFRSILAIVHPPFLNSFSMASLAGLTYMSLSFGFSILPAGFRGMLV